MKSTKLLKYKYLKQDSGRGGSRYYTQTPPGAMIILGMILLVLTASIGKAQSTTPVNQVPYVKNAGIGGNNTVDMLGRIGKDCLAFKPDLTIVMAGTNDMNSVKYVPLAQYKKNLASILDSIKLSGSKVLLMNILPFFTPYLLKRHPIAFYGDEGPDGRQASVNQAIAQIARQRHIPLLDIHHYFESIGNIGLDKSNLIRNQANSQREDGVHPTPEGYRIIATLVYAKILSAHLPHNRIVCFGDSITKGDGSITGNSYPAFLLQLLQP